MTTSPSTNVSTSTTLRRGGRDEALLGRLLSEVNRARARFRAGRSGLGNATGRADQTQRAGDVAEAMQSYADAAASSGIPLPYRYRDELRLYRAMAATSPRDGRSRGH